MRTLLLETIPTAIPFSRSLRVLILLLTISPGNDAFKSCVIGSLVARLYLFSPFVLSFVSLLYSAVCVFWTLTNIAHSPAVQLVGSCL
jgi:hypothetical protein